MVHRAASAGYDLRGSFWKAFVGEAGRLCLPGGKLKNKCCPPCGENKVKVSLLPHSKVHEKGPVVDTTYPTSTFFVSYSTPDRVTSLSPDDSCSRDDFVFRVEVFSNTS